jgi:outer membrane protein assembly factor BamB
LPQTIANLKSLNDLISCLIAAGPLYALREKRGLMLVKPNPGKFEKISEFKTGLGRCWTMPVVSNGRLYFRDKTNPICHDLKAKKIS